MKYCDSKNIHITAYSAFGNNSIGAPLLITRPEILAIAKSMSEKTGKTVTGAHVVLAWSQVGGHSVIPKSVNPSRIRENFQEVELSAEDVETVNELGRIPKRFNCPRATYKPRWDVDIFGEEEEKIAKNKIVLSV